MCINCYKDLSDDISKCVYLPIAKMSAFFTVFICPSETCDCINSNYLFDKESKYSGKYYNLNNFFVTMFFCF